MPIPAAGSLVPLSAAEIEAAAAAVRRYCDAGTNPLRLRFVAVSLLEDGKDVAGRRCAEAVVLNPSTGLASELVVVLGDGEEGAPAEVTSCVTLPPGRQPMFTPDDCDLAERIVQESEWVQRVLSDRYGITDMERVACDPWSVHLAGGEDDLDLTEWRKKEKERGEGGGEGGGDAGREDTVAVPPRLIQTFLYLRQNGDGLQDNHYACPIDVLPVVDLNAEKVVHVVGLDRNPPPVLPKQSVNYHRDLIASNTYLQTSWRSDVLKTLNVVQPDGPSFRVNAATNGVEWQKWTFQVGFNYREGAVLHNLSFDGRTVLKRMSLVEMAVPYADPSPPFQRKCAFDVGDYGLGYCANSLELGCDCLGTQHGWRVGWLVVFRARRCQKRLCSVP
jgi:primary-amine oxidase